MQQNHFFQFFIFKDFQYNKFGQEIKGGGGRYKVHRGGISFNFERAYYMQVNSIFVLNFKLWRKFVTPDVSSLVVKFITQLLTLVNCSKAGADIKISWELSICF